MDFSNYTIKELLRLYWQIEGELFKRTWWVLIILILIIIFLFFIRRK